MRDLKLASRRVRVQNDSFKNEGAEICGGENYFSQAQRISVDNTYIVLTMYLALF